MVYHDKGTANFNEEQAFLQVLEDVVILETSWSKVRINQMRFIPIGEMTERLTMCA